MISENTNYIIHLMVIITDLYWVCGDNIVKRLNPPPPPTGFNEFLGRIEFYDFYLTSLLTTIFESYYQNYNMGAKKVQIS
jgi:hypothetical protein